MRRAFRLSVIVLLTLILCLPFSSKALAEASGSAEETAVIPTILPEVRTIRVHGCASSVHIVETHSGTVRIGKAAGQRRSKNTGEYETAGYGRYHIENSGSAYTGTVSDEISIKPQQMENKDSFEDDIYSHFTEEELVYFEEQPIYKDSVFELADTSDDMEGFGETDDVIPDESAFYDDSEIDDSDDGIYMIPDITETGILIMEETGMRAE